MHDAFKVHMLTANGRDRARRLAEAFNDALSTAIGIMREGEFEPPNRRYEALVITKMEEACFFAKKGMAEVSSEET